MPSPKNWLGLLTLEVAAIFLALLVFNSPMNQDLAATIAGSGFLLVGLLAMIVSFAGDYRWRWLTAYASIAHVCASLSLLIQHFWGLPNVLGLMNPEAFHQLSENLYLLLLLTTFLDMLRSFRYKKTRS